MRRCGLSVARKTNSRKPIAFVVAAVLLLSFLIPFVGVAVANHTAGATLEVSLETAENTTGTTHSLTATFFNGSDPTVSTCGTAPDCIIRFEVESGAAVVVTSDDQTGTGGQRTTDSDASFTSPDMTCRIAVGASSCTVEFTSNTANTNVIRAWHDHDRDPATTAEVDLAETRYSNGPTTTGRAYVTDCRDARGPASADPSCTTQTSPNQGVAEPDLTDVVSKTWISAVAGNPCIDAEPNTDDNASGTDHVITARVTNGAIAADLDGTFDCTGSAVSGTTVRITVTDDDPNVFVLSAGPTAPGTATTGQPNTIDAVTGPNGEVTFTVRCVDPNCTGTNTFTVAIPGAAGGGNTGNPDTVTKNWFAAGAAASLDATPERDTNVVGQTHTITCTVPDVAGTGTAAANCDAQVIGGTSGNVGRDIDANTTTAAGYIGQCFTAAATGCTITYASNFTGTDTICVWRDANGNNLPDDTGVNCAEGIDDATPTDDFADVIFKDWVATGAGPGQVRLDMEPDADPCADFDQNALANPPRTVHEICALAQSLAGGGTPTQITFTITSGPGFFTNTAGTADFGATRTAEADNTGENHVFLRSNTAGTTTVQACITGTQTCVTGTKPWQVAAPTEARNIDLTPPTATNETNTLHTVTATVIDVNGNPVPGVTISWTISGVGGFVNRDATTDANGTANATITSGTEGTSTVTATISTAGTQCTQPVGTPAGATTAGNCADTATKTWDDDVEPEPECNDEIDNDADGEIDFPDDPGCESAADDDERDFVVPEECTGEGIIAGTDGADVLTGTADDDVICGFGGNDTLNGLGGNDVLLGGGGDDELNGGDGADSIEGDVVAACLQTGCAAGNDTADGGGAKDTIRGDAGNDLLLGGNKNDLIVGGQGNDNIQGQAGWDTIRGNAGDDRLIGNAGNDILQGGVGNDLATGGAGNDTIRGFVGRDNLRGGGGSDIIKGGGGRDQLRGGRGPDVLDGGAGRDACFGGPGKDVLRRCE